MPALRQREKRLEGELGSLSAQLADQAAYLLRRVFPRSWSACGPTLRALTYKSASASRGCSSRGSWPVPTASPFATQFPRPGDQGEAATWCPDRLAHHKSGDPAKVIFCVHGLISPLLMNLLMHHAFDA